MSETKTSLVSMVAVVKYRAAAAAGEQTMRESVAATFESLSTGRVASEIAAVLQRVR